MYLAAIVVIHVDDATWYLSWRSVTMAWMNGSAKPARVSMMRATTSGSNSSRPYPTTSLPMASAPTAVSRLLKSEIPPVPCRAATSQMLAARAEVMPYFRARSRAAIALATSKRTSDEWNLVVSPRSWSSTPTYSTSSSRSDRKSTRLNSSHITISYAVFCLKKKKKKKKKQKHKKKKTQN